MFDVVKASPDDPLVWVALADWLEEAGRLDLAGSLRAEPGLVRFLADSLRWDRTPDHHWLKQCQDRRSQGPWALARATADLLAGFWPANPPPVNADRLAALAAWCGERTREIRQLRQSAATAADLWKPGQPVSQNPESPRDLEHLACLFHEIILRGYTSRDVPDGPALHSALRAVNHPLAAIPPMLAPFELRSGGRRSPQPLVAGGGPVEVNQWEAPSPGAAGYSAVAGWMAESNGRAEAATLHLTGPAGRIPADPSWLAGLGLEPLVGATDFHRLSPEDSYRALFDAAAIGGAYGGWQGGAYGRLRAWRSLAWLAGLENPASGGLLAARVVQCEWYTFTSPWFDGIAWDLGLIVLRPDRRSVAVLAATDTD